MQFLSIKPIHPSTSGPAAPTLRTNGFDFCPSRFAFLLSFLLLTSPLSALDSDEEEPARFAIAHQQEGDCLITKEQPESPTLFKELWWKVFIFTDGCDIHLLPEDGTIEADKTPALKGGNSLFIRRKDGSVSDTLAPKTLGLTLTDLEELRDEAKGSSTVFLKYSHKILKAIHNAGHTGQYVPWPLISKAFHKEFQWLYPNVRLSSGRSPWNWYSDLPILEACEKMYVAKGLTLYGFEVSYPPYYEQLVGKISDAEGKARLSPLSWCLSGYHRVQRMRKVHEFPTPSLTIRSSFHFFTHDPFVCGLATLSAASLVGLSAYTLYTSINNYNNHFSYYYPIALNMTTSEEFPQSLININNLETWKLYNCYTRCYGLNNFMFGHSYFVPQSLCQNPNVTSPEYVDLILNITAFLKRGCGPNISDVWSSWLNQSFGDYITILFQNFTDSGYMRKLKNQTLFIYQDWDVLTEIDGMNGTYCQIRPTLYSYDPACIAKHMATPPPITGLINGWSSLLGITSVVYIIVMVVGCIV